MWTELKRKTILSQFRNERQFCLIFSLYRGGFFFFIIKNKTKGFRRASGTKKRYRRALLIEQRIQDWFFVVWKIGQRFDGGRLLLGHIGVNEVYEQQSNFVFKKMYSKKCLLLKSDSKPLKGKDPQLEFENFSNKLGLIEIYRK